MSSLNEAIAESFACALTNIIVPSSFFADKRSDRGPPNRHPE
jgi:hypothetical protein